MSKRAAAFILTFAVIASVCIFPLGITGLKADAGVSEPIPEGSGIVFEGFGGDKDSGLTAAVSADVSLSVNADEENAQYYWYTDNDSVLSFDDCNAADPGVTLLAKGTAIVFVDVLNTDSEIVFTDTVSITVNSSDAVSVDKTVRWLDSNNAIAEVNLSVTIPGGYDSVVGKTRIVLAVDMTKHGTDDALGQISAAVEQFLGTLGSFVEDNDDVEIAILGYSDSVYTICDFTDSIENLTNAAISEIVSDNLGEASFAQAALFDAQAMLENENASNSFIVLFSSGIPTRSYLPVSAEEVSDTMTGNAKYYYDEFFMKQDEVTRENCKLLISGFSDKAMTSNYFFFDYDFSFNGKDYWVDNHGYCLASTAVAIKDAGTRILTVGIGIEEDSAAETVMTSVASGKDSFFNGEDAELSAVLAADELYYSVREHFTIEEQLIDYFDFSGVIDGLTYSAILLPDGAVYDTTAYFIIDETTDKGSGVKTCVEADHNSIDWMLAPSEDGGIYSLTFYVMFDPGDWNANLLNVFSVYTSAETLLTFAGRTIYFNQPSLPIINYNVYILTNGVIAEEVTQKHVAGACLDDIGDANMPSIVTYGSYDYEYVDAQDFPYEVTENGIELFLYYEATGITISSQGFSAEYNGSDFYGETPFINTYGALGEYTESTVDNKTIYDFEGFTFTVEYEQKSIKNVGNIFNSADAYTLEFDPDVEEIDIPILTNYGLLEVFPRDIEITASSSERDYNGTELTDPNYSITGGSFVSGEGFASVTVEGSLLFGDPVENVITGYTFNENTLSQNYNVTTVNGTLTVNSVSVPLTVAASGIDLPYDGTAHTADSYELTGDLLGNDVLDVKIEGTITDAGTIPNNIISCKVTNGTTDVTEMYDITIENGELKISALPITIKANDSSTSYDGTPVSDDGYTITSGSFVGTDGFTSVTVEGSSLFGDQENKIVSYVLTESTKPGNYVITCDDGLLSVDKSDKIITVTANDGKWTYDGNEHSETGITYTGELFGDDKIVAVTEGVITDAGKTENKVVSVMIMNGTTDVTEAYTIETAPGTLEVEPAAITITANSAEKTYDGSPLTDSGYKITSGAFAGNDGFASVTVEGSVTDEKTSGANVIKGYTLKDGTKEANYVITFADGTLTVNEKPVQTGDTSNNTLLLVLAVAALISAGACALAIAKKKAHEQF